MKLHGYFRSSASYRVRIALNLKGLGADHLSHHLRKGEQCAPAYLAINPQGLVPTLVDDAGVVLTQSLAIIEWLDETHPEPPLLPKQPLRRAKVRAFAMALACDTHPVQNLKVLARLRELGLPEEQVTGWAAWANREGLSACETLIADEPGPFCFGDTPTLADLCLVPQLANARRFGVDVAVYPRLLKAEAAAKANKAFADAAPERSPMPSKPDTVTMDAVYSAPGYLFRRMQQIAVSIFVEECRAHDPTPVQFAALVAIRTHPGIDATRLSAVIAFDRSTLGSVIERLEAKNYIERKPGRDDKSVKLLHMTPAGAALLRDIMPSVDRAQARMLQPLRPADRKTLMALLTQLVDLNNEASRVPLRAEDALEHLGKST